MANNYENIVEILKNTISIIDDELNNYFENLTENEAIDFLKWLEFELLNKWKINKELNSQQTNIVANKFFAGINARFNQKIDYLENWLKEKKTNKPINLKSVKITISNNLTFTQYKNDYVLLLENYLKQYVDNTEQTFIQQQLFCFNEFLSFVVNGAMTKAKKQMLLEDLEQSTTLENLQQSTEQKIEFLEYKLKDVSNNKTPQQSQPKPINKTKDYKNTFWFKTGITLATGEAFNLYYKYKEDKGHFTKLCLELGFEEKYRPYFSETINNNDSDKNTFANKDKLQKLHKYLTENQLNFGAEFLRKYNQIEPE